MNGKHVSIYTQDLHLYPLTSNLSTVWNMLYLLAIVLQLLVSWVTQEILCDHWKPL